MNIVNTEKKKRSSDEYTARESLAIKVRLKYLAIL